MATLLVVGFGLLFWGAYKIDTYPQMKEIRKAAFETVKYQYLIGFGLMIIAYILSLSFFKNLFK
jgi:hypothetical protein